MTQKILHESSYPHSGIKLLTGASFPWPLFTFKNEAWPSVRYCRLYNDVGIDGGAPGAQVRVVSFPTRSTGSSKHMPYMVYNEDAVY